MEQKYMDYLVEQAKNLLAIPSPTGYNQEIQAYLRESWPVWDTRRPPAPGAAAYPATSAARETPSP